MWPFHLHTFYCVHLQVPMEMEMVLLVVYTTLFLSALLMFCLPLIGHQKSKFHGRAKLPPGSMGWPYLGETLQFYSQNPNLFFAQKQKRYGEIFKTHLLGCPCVMLASPEAAKFVLVNQSHMFKPTYPKSKEYMIGPSALFFHQGDYHSRLRKLVQGSLSPESIRRLVPGIEAVAVEALAPWDCGGAVMNSFHEMKKFSFDVGILTIFGQLNAIHREELKKNYWIMDKGYNSFPTNIPGTLYNNAVLARRRLSKIVSEIICGTRERRLAHKDLLGCLMDHQDEKGETISDEQIADNIIGVLFAAMDTTASILTWILKYLHDDPKLLESVMEEQRPIYEANNRGKRPLAWSQTRSMPLTHKVILESLRMSSIVSFTFREAVADVEYNGYLIPKGWKVMPLFRNIHHNPELFPDPHKFDPTRFEVSPKPNTFLPFGSGVHSCPGNELAKLEILIMLHHLVTKFRWEVIGSESGIQYGPFPVPKHGLPARFWKLAEPPAQRFGRHA